MSARLSAAPKFIGGSAVPFNGARYTIANRVGRRQLIDSPEFNPNSDIAKRFQGLRDNIIAFRTRVEKNDNNAGSDVSGKSFEERVQDELINLKSLVSRVSVHLPTDFRKLIFQQFDRLYDLEDWTKEDCFIKSGSCSTFLKLICDIQPTKFPSLGISDSGDIMASWRNDRSKLIVYMFEEDRIRWNLFVNDQDAIEQFADQQNVKGFKTVLSNHGFLF